MERGSIDDWRQLKAYYSIETINNAAVNARSLEPTAMSFAAIMTQTQIENI